jgi:hypothetical protein
MGLKLIQKRQPCKVEQYGSGFRIILPIVFVASLE